MKTMRDFMNSMPASPISEGKIIRIQKFNPWTGDSEYRVTRNPSSAEITRNIRSAKNRSLRFIIDGSDMFIWDGFFDTHPSAAKKLGISYSFDKMKSGELITGILSLEDADNILVHHVNPSSDGTISSSPMIALNNTVFQRSLRGLPVIT